MDRRRLLVTTGTVLSAGLAGCLGGEEDTEPTQPYIEQSGISVETSPVIRATVPVENPTDETITRTVWIRLNDDNGDSLAERSQTVTVNPGADGGGVFTFTRVTFQGSDIDTNNIDTALTETGAESPL